MLAAAYDRDILSVFGKLHRHLYTDKSGSDNDNLLFGIGIVLHLINIVDIFGDSEDAFELQTMFECSVDKGSRASGKDKFVEAYLSLSFE